MSSFPISVKETVVSLQDGPKPDGFLGARLSRSNRVVVPAYLNGSLRVTLEVRPPLRISKVARIGSRHDIAPSILDVEKRGNVTSAALASHMGKEKSTFLPAH